MAIGAFERLGLYRNTAWVILMAKRTSFLCSLYKEILTCETILGPREVIEILSLQHPRVIVGQFYLSWHSSLDFTQGCINWIVNIVRYMHSYIYKVSHISCQALANSSQNTFLRGVITQVFILAKPVNRVFNKFLEWPVRDKLLMIGNVWINYSGMKQF